MRKLSEIQNEEALDVIADIIEPVIEICQDTDLKAAMGKADKVTAVKIAIKSHKTAVLSILATLDGETLDTYKVNIIQLPIKILEIFNDKDMMDFFQSQGLMISGTSSGSAMANIEGTETE